MSSELRLVIPAHGASIPTDCVCCGEAFFTELGTPVVYQDDQPHGYICIECAAAPPSDSVPKLQRRIHALLAFRARASASLPSLNQTATSILSVQRRIDYWSRLAERLSGMTVWEVERHD